MDVYSPKCGKNRFLLVFTYPNIFCWGARQCLRPASKPTTILPWSLLAYWCEGGAKHVQPLSCWGSVELYEWQRSVAHSGSMFFFLLAHSFRLRNYGFCSRNWLDNMLVTCHIDTCYTNVELDSTIQLATGLLLRLDHLHNAQSCIFVHVYLYIYIYIHIIPQHLIKSMNIMSGISLLNTSEALHLYFHFHRCLKSTTW